MVAELKVTAVKENSDVCRLTAAVATPQISLNTEQKTMKDNLIGSATQKRERRSGGNASAVFKPLEREFPDSLFKSKITLPFR